MVQTLSSGTHKEPNKETGEQGTTHWDQNEFGESKVREGFLEEVAPEG